MTAGQTTAIQVNNHIAQNQSSSGQQKDTLSISRALEILEDSGQNAASNLDQLNDKYSGLELPEIRASHQQGQAVDEQGGLSLSKIKAEQIEIDNHLARREEDLGPIEEDNSQE